MVGQLTAGTVGVVAAVVVRRAVLGTEAVPLAQAAERRGGKEAAAAQQVAERMHWWEAGRGVGRVQCRHRCCVLSAGAPEPRWGQ